jgi:hypothetical protein
VLLLCSKVRAKKKKLFNDYFKYYEKIKGLNDKSIEIPYIRLISSCPANWMHVVDDNVWVAIDRGELHTEYSGKDKSVFVSLTEDNTRAKTDGSVAESTEQGVKSPKNVNKIKYRQISKWAYKDIRRHAARGALTEEYLLSVIRYVLLNNTSASYPEPAYSITLVNIQAHLFPGLGFDTWWESNKSKLKGEMGLIKEICAAVFLDFINAQIRPSEDVQLEDVVLKDLNEGVI